jgi:hypothetical protein
MFSALPTTRLPIFLVIFSYGLAAQQSPSLQEYALDPAERAREVLEELQTDHESQRGGKTYQLTQEELNSYLVKELRENNQLPVQSVSVVLNHDSFETILEVDVSQLQQDDPGKTENLLGFLFRGPQKLALDGTIQTELGVGTYLLREVRLNGFPIPMKLVNELLSSLGEKQNLPFDPSQPFKMPLGIQSLHFLPGLVTIET